MSLQAFELVRARTLAAAQEAVIAGRGGAQFRAGGVDLMDRMKEGLEAPTHLVELRTVADAELALCGEREGALHLGALVTLAGVERELRAHPARAALLDAVAETATPSLRNQATLGGNLLQRPRCWYFRNAELPCLKKGGDLCLSVAGDNRYHAILGGGPSYIVHPSSLAPALLALGARAITRGVDGSVRERALAELFVLPAESYEREHRLAPGEVLTRIVLPAVAADSRSANVAARERAAHDWPLAEAAVAMRCRGGEGSAMSEVRIVLGHVAPVPWPATRAAAMLEGERAGAELFARAAEAATTGALPLSANRYKVRLVQGLVRHALHRASGIPLPP